MPPNPSAAHQGETKGQLPTCPNYSPWGSSDGTGRRVSLECQGTAQHLPPSSQKGFRLSLSSQAVLPGSSGLMEAAATRAGALLSALSPCHQHCPPGCGGHTTNQTCCRCPVPWHGCIMGSGLGQCPAESRGNGQGWLSRWIQVFSCFQLHQRWISPGQYHAGVTSRN